MIHDTVYESDTAYESDDSLIALFRGSEQVLDEEWVRQLEDDLCNRIGTNSKEVGTNSKESDERFYMGLPKEWRCQRCGTLSIKGAKDFLQDCKTCKANAYLSHKITGVGVDINASKPRGTSLGYCSARIFHSDSKDTPFEIDTENASMRVTLRDTGSGLLHGTQTFKLLKGSVVKLRQQLGRGLVGTIADNVDRAHPETVLVRPAGGGDSITIENPQFAVRYTDDPGDPWVSNDLPRNVTSQSPSPPKRKRNATTMGDSGMSIEADAASLFDKELVSEPPRRRPRRSIRVIVYLDDMHRVYRKNPVFINDVSTLAAFKNEFIKQHGRANNTFTNITGDDPLTQQTFDAALSNGDDMLKVLVRSPDSFGESDLVPPYDPLSELAMGEAFEQPMGINSLETGEPSTNANGEYDGDNVDNGSTLRDVPAMSTVNPFMMNGDSSFVDDNAIDNWEPLVDDEEEEKGDEEENGENFEWSNATQMDLEHDSLMYTPFEMPNGDSMSLAQYLDENPDLRPWRNYFAPHRMSLLSKVPHPFMIPLPLLFENGRFQSQKYINMHNNALALAGLGLGPELNDSRFVSGVMWDVEAIINAEEMKRKKEQLKEEKRAIKERKLEEQESERQRKKRDKEAAGMVREAAKRADRERRIAAAEENHTLKAQLKEEERVRRNEAKELMKQRKTDAQLNRLLTSSANVLETDEERRLRRDDALNRCKHLPWWRDDLSGGIAKHPDTQNPVLFADVPDTIRSTLHWLMAYRLFLHKRDPLTNEMLFRNVNRYYGRPVLSKGKTDYSKRQWRSWQLQRKINGTLTFLGQYFESVLAALVNAASIIDSRIDSSECAQSWVVWISDPDNALQWLQDPVVVQGLTDQEHEVSARFTSRTQDKDDDKFRTHNPTYVAPDPTVIDISDASNPPPPPPPPHLPRIATDSERWSNTSPPQSSLHPLDATTSSDPLAAILPMPEAPLGMEGVTDRSQPPSDLHLDPHDRSQYVRTGDDGVNTDIDVETSPRDLEKMHAYVSMSGATPDTARFLYEEGYSASDIVSVNLFDITNLMGVIPVDSLVAAGVDPMDLLSAGASASDLVTHIPINILRDWGYSNSELGLE